MNLRRTLVLGALAGSVAAVTTFGVHELAGASQRPVVVRYFYTGTFNSRGHFVKISGRDSQEVDRNSVLLFVFSGAVNSGRKQLATLPLTLAEQQALLDEIAQGGDIQGFEPGVIPRKDSPFRDGRYIAGGSVSEASIRVASPGSGGSTLAPGAFFKMQRGARGNRVFRNRILFNPRFTAATFNRANEIDYNPAGLAPLTIYTVDLEGGPNIQNVFNAVTNLDGIPLAAPFSTTLETSSGYVQDFTRPLVRTIFPGVDAVNVASDTDIEFEFTEPMDAASFQPPRFQGDDEWTVRVSYTEKSINGSLAGRNVLGTLREKPQTAGNVIQFRPIQGYGSGPYEIEVIITAGVTDLSGNNIVRQQRSTFTTAFDPTAEDFSSVEEPFESTDARDNSFVPTGDYRQAEWDSFANPGVIRTDVVGLAFDASAGSGGSLNTWFTSTIFLHMLYPRADMGDRARTITGFSWFPGTVRGNTYPSTVMQMGPATESLATSGFTTTSPPQATNFAAVPVTVVSAQTYTVPGIGLDGLVAGPTFSKVFNYDGASAMIMSLAHGGHGLGATQDETWGSNTNYAINVITALVAGGATPQVFRVYQASRFYFLSPGAEAQSLWYNVGIPDARYLPQILVPFAQPNGTQVNLIWQGARATAIDPNSIDPTTITDWVTDVRQLSNNQFVRWQMRLINNTGTKVSPEVESLSVPYTFKKVE